MPQSRLDSRQLLLYDVIMLAMRVVAFNVVGSIVCAAALVVSVRYFLLSKPADNEPLNRASLIFGRIHPQVLVRVFIAAAMICSFWLLSNAVAARGYRLLAGLILAVAAPAAIVLLFTLLALLFTRSSREPTPREHSQISSTPNARITAWIFFVAIIIGAALIPILR
jgi:hypothetical protein